MSNRLFDKRWFRIVLGLLAFIGMVALAAYQRRTGPTWPIPVLESVGEGQVSGELPRSHGGEGGAEISLVAPADVIGEIRWRRYPTQDEWYTTAMARQGEALTSELPHQPPAGKLEYSVRLTSPDRQFVFPEGQAAVIRFRADVPAWVLIPHILCMFIALAIVLRSALGALLNETNVGRFAPWILGFLIPGGFILGPMVQKFAFGAYWTGWPFGTDWTDNKTLFALAAWILVLVIGRWRPQLVRGAVLIAAAIMMAVYLIPHSIHGSELDWSETETGQTLIEPAAKEPKPPVADDVAGSPGGSD